MNGSTLFVFIAIFSLGQGSLKQKFCDSYRGSLDCLKKAQEYKLIPESMVCLRAVRKVVSIVAKVFTHGRESLALFIRFGEKFSIEEKILLVEEGNLVCWVFDKEKLFNNVTCWKRVKHCFVGILRKT